MPPMWSRVILILSLVANALLAVWLLRSDLGRSGGRSKPAWELQPKTNIVETVVKTNLLVQQRLFTWKEIESRDYPTYIANLRNIGCPELTIRDIIVAEVNLLYSHKRATEVTTADQQWWRLERDPEVTKASMEKLAALEQERRALLTQLLGQDWERGLNQGTMAPMGTVSLNGPVLGALSDEAKQSVYEINNRSRDRINKYYDEMAKAGKQPDPAEVARLNQQTRAELAQVLDGNQMEEYLLRYSDTANDLRRNLMGVEVSPDEFRAMFRAQDPYQQELLRYSGDDPASAQRREELAQQSEAALKRALTPDRYATIKLNQDPDFQKAKNTVMEYGGSAESVLPLFEINSATEKEIQRIKADPGLSEEQLNNALEAIQTAHQQSLRQLLGEQAYQRYLQNQGK